MFLFLHPNSKRSPWTTTNEKTKNKITEVHDMITLISWFCLLGTSLKSHREYTDNETPEGVQQSMTLFVMDWAELTGFQFQSNDKISKEYSQFFYSICLYT